MSKICSKCGEEKKLTLEFFYKRSRKKKDGTRSFMSMCKCCKNKSNLQHIQKFMKTEKGRMCKKRGNDNYVRTHKMENRMRSKLYYYKVVKPRKMLKKLQERE